MLTKRQALNAIFGVNFILNAVMCAIMWGIVMFAEHGLGWPLGPMLFVNGWFALNVISALALFAADD